MPQTLILASSSPRRRELLAALGVDFAVFPPHVNEDPLPGESPLETQHRITRDKARAAGAALADGDPPPVLACDTTVLLDGEMLNKPVDAADAARMLRALRGRMHEVQSCVVVRAAGQERIECASSYVRMRDYSDVEIADYVAGGDPFDKAGAYAVQHAEFNPVAGIVGCPLNVMGLPLCWLRKMLPGLPSPEEVCRALAVQLPSVSGAACLAQS